MKRKLQLLTGIGCLCLCFLSCSQPPYKNPALSPEERANDLVGRLTLEEKAALMQNTSPAIPRLGIKAYDWWNEALHGVGRAGLATVFPQAIGMGAFISISGRGVKLFIRIDIDGVNDYPAIYEATAKLVSTVLGVENDGKCKDITHPCFGSYDPDAYYNGDAKAVNDFLPNGALTPRVTYAPVTSAPRTTCTPTSFSNGHPPAKAGNRISAAPFVQSYLTLYPAVTGDRNGTVFRLSCAACKRGIDRTELTTELVRTLEEDNFREPEIARTVKSAYQNIMTAAETESFENPPSNSSKVQKSVIGFSENENPAEKEDEIIGEELREQTPTFPDEIYDLIPAIFKECVSIARDERERDGLLLSCITTISSMLPSVNIRYNRRNYQPNIYCIVVASSGANKNLIGYGIRLHKHYCD